jgi:hypothetical protein
MSVAQSFSPIHVIHFKLDLRRDEAACFEQAGTAPA